MPWLVMGDTIEKYRNHRYLQNYRYFRYWPEVSAIRYWAYDVFGQWYLLMVKYFVFNAVSLCASFVVDLSWIMDEGLC